MRNKIIKNLNRGFSLMETLIWVGIVGIFVGIVGIAGVSYWDRARVKAATQEMNVYSAALLDYYDKNGSFPTSDEGLKILLEQNYIKQTKFLDPWKNPYIYNATENGFTIKSLGSDKKEGGTGTKEDIMVYEGDSDQNGDDFE